MGDMDFAWLKRFMPRGLYARAALILLLPFITLQLVVSAAILQRYFEGVARQMTQAATLELALVLDRLDRNPAAAAEIAGALGIAIAPRAGVAGDRRLFYDLTGIEVIRVLRRDMPGLLAVDLRSDRRRARIAIETASGPVTLSVPRARLSVSNPHQILVVTLFTGLLMAAVAYLFLRNQLRPIRTLAHAAEAFGKGQVVDYTPSGATEARGAGRAFLDMRDRIEGMLEQRTMMLSGVSHDLRTPLTRMQLGLSMLDPTDEVAALARDVEEMEALVDTFLDFARAEALDDPVAADPVALARRCVEDARRAGGDVSLAAADANGPVALREKAVHRALSNLVSNALRHGRRARISVVWDETALRFVVEDDGLGIPARQREDAVRPFVRLDAARNQDRGGGAGLGLAIAEDIARRHGGALDLGDSTDLGGLRITLTLPR